MKGAERVGINYIPRPDGDFNPWILNFNTKIGADPTAYGLSADDATALNTLTVTWSAAFTAAKGDSTRSPVTIAAKDTARANVEGRARELAIRIQANPAVTNEQKTALGITVRKTGKTPVPVPASSPVLIYVASTPLEMTFQFRDQNTLDFKARPFGAIMLQVSVWITPVGTAPSGPPTKQFDVTRNPFAAEFDAGDVGKMATFIANWKNAKAELGPDSVTLQRVIC